MRSVGGLFERVVSAENLAAALARASRGKRDRVEVRAFLAHADAEVAALRGALLAGEWAPCPLLYFHILDPKPRLIGCAAFRDRVVHHAVCAEIGPVIERRLTGDSYACRVGKGSHRAVLRACALAKEYAFWLRTDIRHHYETIDHDVLLAKVTGLFRERRLQRLLETIARQPVRGSEPGKGLPIGSLTSQWFANVLLDGIDHWVRETRRASGYLRYMDDFAAWSDSKDLLFGLASDLEAKLREELRLEMKREATIVAPATEGMPFLGYRVFPGMVREKGGRVRRRRRLLARREAEFRRGELSEEQLQSCVRSMAGPRAFLGFGEPLGMP